VSTPASVDKLKKLCRAVFAISPNAEIRLKPNSQDPYEWFVLIMVGEAIVTTSKVGPLEDVLDEVNRNLGTISERMMKALKGPGDEEP
jgi:hypothetical protein